MWPFKKRFPDRLTMEDLRMFKERISKRERSEKKSDTWIGRGKCTKCGQITTVSSDIKQKEDFFGPGRPGAVCDFCKNVPITFTWTEEKSN